MVATREGVTVIIICPDVAGDPVTQLALDVMIHSITSPLVNDVLEKAEELVPAFTPFILHWKVGVAPPLTAVAVKSTCVPSQMLESLAIIETPATIPVETVMVTEFEVTTALETQFSFEVNIQVTTSLLFKVVELKKGLLVPTFTPLTIH